MKHTYGKIKGYLLGIIAAVSYGTLPLFTLPLYEAGLNAESVLTQRYVLAIVILGVMMRLRGISFRISSRELVPLLTGGMMMSLSSLTLFASYRHMSAGIASTLLFAYPMMVAAIMALFFRERLGGRTLLCLLGATAGIVLLCKTPDTTETVVTAYGVILALASGLTYAVYMVIIKKTAVERMEAMKLTFYILLFGLALFVIRFAIGTPFTVLAASSSALWGNIIALAVIATVISFICTTASIHSIGVTPTAILGAFEPLTALFFGITVFGEVLEMRQWAGVALVIASVTLLVGARAINPFFVRIHRSVAAGRNGKS